MAYSKQTWANDAGGGTPLSASRLNHMEDGIEAVDTGKLPAAETAVGEVTGSVVFTFDGGTEGHYDLAWPEFSSRGHAATWFIWTSVIDTPGYCTTAELVEMLDDGQEIASHSVNHQSHVGRSEAYLRAEFGGSKTWLEDNVLASAADQSAAAALCARTYCYPGGSHDLKTRQIVGEYYDCSRTVNTLPSTDHLLGKTAVHITSDGDSESEAAMEAKMDTALAEGTDMVVLMHVIDAAAATKIGNLLDYADSIGLPVRTFVGAYDERHRADLAEHGAAFGRDGSIGASTVSALRVRGSVVEAESFYMVKSKGETLDPALRIEHVDNSTEIQTRSGGNIILQPDGNDVEIRGQVILSNDDGDGIRFESFAGAGIRRPNGIEGVDLLASSAAQLQAQAGTTDADTGILVRVNRSGTYSLDRVTIGAADSGGTGFRVLRVPN